MVNRFNDRKSHFVNLRLHSPHSIVKEVVLCRFPLLLLLRNDEQKIFAFWTFERVSNTQNKQSQRCSSASWADHGRSRNGLAVALCSRPTHLPYCLAATIFSLRQCTCGAKASVDDRHVTIGSINHHHDGGRRRAACENIKIRSTRGILINLHLIGECLSGSALISRCWWPASISLILIAPVTITWLTNASECARFP